MPGSGTAVPPDEPPLLPPEVDVVVPPEVVVPPDVVVVPPEVEVEVVVVPPEVDVVVVPPEVLLLDEEEPQSFLPALWPQPHECLWLLPPQFQVACAGALRPMLAAVVSESASSVLRNIVVYPLVTLLIDGCYAITVPIADLQGFGWLTTLSAQVICKLTRQGAGG